jgi:hypothetical protein
MHSNAFSTSTANSNDTIWQPSSYPLCNVPSHHPEPVPHLHEVIARQSTRVSSVTLPAAPPRSPTPGLSSTTRPRGASFVAPIRRPSTQLPTEPPPSDVANEPRRFFVHTSSHSSSPESQSVPTASPKIDAVQTTPGNSDMASTSLIVDPTSQPSDCATSQRSQETTAIPSSVVSEATALPVPMQTVSSDAIPVEHPSASESHPNLPTPVDPVSDDSVSPNIEMAGAPQRDTGGQISPTQMEDSSSSYQSASGDPIISASTPPPPDERQLDSDQS